MPMTLLGLLALVAHAGDPVGAWPDCTPDNREACPSELDWDTVSWIPDASLDSIRPEERDLGSGVSLDRALRYTAGSWDVTVAVVDSGIDWRDTQAADKVLLNARELPLPQRADGTEVEGGDLDGNGIFNVRDYAEDPRVDITAGVERADDRLDPSDLIATFSDGVDDDGNGYVDDIAGWDFFEHDNDPYAGFLEGYSGHGTGVAKGAVAWSGDGGDIGTCPDCSLLPVRIGEAFVTDGDRVALALAYLTDRGASSASMAIGALSRNSGTDAAAAYASEHGVVLVAAGGDENSFHRNVPASGSPFLFVKSIRAADRRESGNAWSYMGTWNCNNFGPRMDLAAPSEACATGATSRIAGIAALVHAAGLEAGTPLSAAQVRSLLRGTADDIVFDPDDAAENELLPASPGWDPYHGHGRANVGRAVEAVMSGGTIPGVQILGPDWFGHAGEAVDVRFEIEGDVSWVLERGIGLEPDAWSAIASGRGPGTESVRDTPDVLPVPSGDLTDETLFERVARAHEPLVQYRVVATSDDGVVAIDRRGVWRTAQSSLRPGFPVQVAGSIDNGANAADLDGSGRIAVLFATGAGQVHAVDGEGTPLPGWPVSTDPHPHLPASPAWGALDALHEGIIGTPAVGDIDGDGDFEVVATGLSGGVYAWHADGTAVQGFPVRLPTRGPPLAPGFAWDAAILGGAALGDVDGDGALEIALGGGDQQLWVLHGDGSIVDGYPLPLCHPDRCDTRGTRILAPPALGDVDGDGDLDAVLGTGEAPPNKAGVSYLVDLQDAQVLAMYEGSGAFNDTLLPVIGEGHPAPVSLADLDGDGDLELATSVMLSPSNVLHHDGSVAVQMGYTGSDRGGLSPWIEPGSVQMIGSPAFGDLDQDGVPDPVVGVASTNYLFSLVSTRVLDHQHGVSAWSGASGQALTGFPRPIDSLGLLTGATIADVDLDPRPEVVATSSGHFVYAWNAEGELAEGFPLFHGGWALGGPLVTNTSNTLDVDVIATTREGAVFMWRMPTSTGQLGEWPHPRHDASRSGNAQTPLPTYTLEGEDSGCRCDTSGSTGGTIFLVGALLLGLRRRRG